MALTQFDIIKSLGEALAWFERELAWGVPAAELGHLTGRIGELYTAMITYGQMATEVNQRGYDVVSAANERISVKTVTSSSQVTFNLSTFHHVDRVIILRINPEELAIEILLDKPVEEARTLLRETGGNLVFGTRRPRIVRPLDDMQVINRAHFENREILQYENGTIEVLTAGQTEPTAKPILREIAQKLQIELLNSTGTAKNTRQLGDHIVKKLQGLAAQSSNT